MSTSTPPFIDKNSTTLSTTRIEALDYLKCLFVLLMVAFHLAYFADGYPLLKQWVYTFHMPGFLLISGYLMRVDKTLHQFSRTLLWLAVPYLLLESSYITLSAFMPVRDGIEQLTLSTFANKFFLHPLGPYWYLHTLILCGIGYFIVWRIKDYSNVSRFMLLGGYFAGLSMIDLVAWDVSLYFLLGIIIRQSKFTFLEVFRPSGWAFFGLLWMSCHPTTFHKGSLGGVITVYLVISAALYLFPHLSQRLRNVSFFLGRNSLAIFLFSPIFTMLCKVFIPYLAFDSSRLLFLVLSLPLCVIGALAVCRVLDALHLSPWVLGREKALI